MSNPLKENSFENMSNSQKVALLLIALGQQWASAILRQLKTEEVRQISYWINQLEYVPPDVTEQVVRDFYDRLVSRTSLASTGGTDYLVEVLTQFMGEGQAHGLIDELSNTKEDEVFRVLRKVEPKPLAAYLKNEQPQTIALMISYLEPDRAALILQEFPAEFRLEVVSRLATLENTDADVLAAMERSLVQSLGGITSSKKSKKVGGPNAVAEILNSLRQEDTKEIMEALQEANMELATEIKDLMFVFADILLLDDKSIQSVLKEVDQGDLILALKGSSDNVKEKVFGNISKRQAETIEDELSFMGPVKASTVQEAQGKIVNVIRRLDEEGKILIQGKGGGDDIIS